ncbi:MAG: hypothetical protein Q8R91_04990 [Candidatus Omnitrophota bacterium]|nr:hypothetical protein [Candidatus Omnitrophota bacterium]
MRVLLICLAAHVVAAQGCPFPWWVPDLTVVGLVVSVGDAPARWLGRSTLAGFWAAIWAIRFPVVILMGLLAVGWAVRLLARQWDVADPRLQALVVSVAGVVMGCGALCLDGLWSVPLLGLVGARAAVTTITVPLARRLLRF